MYLFSNSATMPLLLIVDVMSDTGTWCVVSALKKLILEIHFAKSRRNKGCLPAYPTPL